MDHRRTIANARAGLSRTCAARAGARQLSADGRLTLLSKESYSTFNPGLPDAFGASICPEQALATRRDRLLAASSQPAPG